MPDNTVPSAADALEDAAEPVDLVEPAPETLAVPGDTFAARAELKALGAVWDRTERVWRIAADKFALAAAIVEHRSLAPPSLAEQVAARKGGTDSLADPFEDEANGPRRVALDRSAGNLYAARDALKAIGASWDKEKRVWTIREDKADYARAIVAAVSGSATFTATTVAAPGASAETTAPKSATLPSVAMNEPLSSATMPRSRASTPPPTAPERSPETPQPKTPQPKTPREVRPEPLPVSSQRSPSPPAGSRFGDDANGGTATPEALMRLSAMPPGRAGGLLRLGGLWESRTRDGRPCMSGRLSATARIVIRKNENRSRQEEPSHLLYLTSGDDKQEDHREEKSQAAAEGQEPDRR